MDINEIIDWIGSRDGIVIADKEKFITDMRERFQESETEGGFLAEVKAYNNRFREKYTKEGQGNCLLVVAGNNDKVSSVWSGSIADLASAYASIAANDDDYVTLMETVSKVLMINKLR